MIYSLLSRKIMILRNFGILITFDTRQCTAPAIFYQIKNKDSFEILNPLLVNNLTFADVSFSLFSFNIGKNSEILHILGIFGPATAIEKKNKEENRDWRMSVYQKLFESFKTVFVFVLSVKLLEEYFFTKGIFYLSYSLYTENRRKTRKA